jgi:hypothetical protein
MRAMATKAKKQRQMRAAKECTCIDKANETLAEYNTRIRRSLTIDFAKKTCGAHPMIETEKIDPHKRAAKKTVVCTYCPICGKKYMDA